jgi:hypothetical protein
MSCPFEVKLRIVRSNVFYREIAHIFRRKTKNGINYKNDNKHGILGTTSAQITPESGTT